jgi:LPS O-antigen subunit length determinant protein (WzzB/FepE family)
MNEKIVEYDDEIELMDLLLVIWRWKVFIISVIAVSMISALIYIYSVPSIYKCSMIIKPAALQQNGLSTKKTFVSATDISREIVSRDLAGKIIKSLKLSKQDLYKGKLSFNVTSVKKTKNIKIEYYCYKLDQGVLVLNSLVGFLNNHFQPEIDYFMGQQNLKILDIDLQINSHQNKLQQILTDRNDQLSYISKEILYWENSKISIEKETGQIQNRIEIIKNQKETIEKKYDVLMGQSKITHLNEKNISDNILYFNIIVFLESKLDRVHALEYNLQMLLLNKQNQIATNFKIYNTLLNNKIKVQNQYFLNKKNIDLMISKLENNKDSEQRNIHQKALAVEILKPPDDLSNSVKPRKKLIIFLSFASSLFISIFCAFLFEYFRNYNKGK